MEGHTQRPEVQGWTWSTPACLAHTLCPGGRPQHPRVSVTKGMDFFLRAWTFAFPSKCSFHTLWVSSLD